MTEVQEPSGLKKAIRKALVGIKVLEMSEKQEEKATEDAQVS